MIKEYKLPDGTFFSASTETSYYPMSESAHVDDVSMTLCTAGATIMEIDMQTYEFTEGCEMILMPGSLVRVMSASPDFRCTELVCSQRFIFNMGMRPDPDFIKFLRFNPVTDIKGGGFLTLAEHFYALACDVCGNAASKHAVDKMRHLVQFYLLNISEETYDKWNDARAIQTDRQTELFRKFIALVHDNATVRHDVEWYAEQMAITPRYLSLLCRSKRASPKAIVDETLVHAAKELLHSTDLTVQEIAAQLSFGDQSVFARFFKRKTGESPIGWRQRVR